MADFKNILTGTLNTLVDKVKEVADNGTVRDIYEQGSSKVRTYGQIAKLTLEVTGDKEELKKLYAEIGRLYVEETQEPDGFFAPLFEQAKLLKEQIEGKEEYIESLKASDVECECCCGDDECCCGDDCCCEGEDCCCEEGIEVELCDFEEVVEATEKEACGENE